MWGPRTSALNVMGVRYFRPNFIFILYFYHPQARSVFIAADERSHHTYWVICGALGRAESCAEVSPSCETFRLGS